MRRRNVLPNGADEHSGVQKEEETQTSGFMEHFLNPKRKLRGIKQRRTAHFPIGDRCLPLLFFKEIAKANKLAFGER